MTFWGDLDGVKRPVSIICRVAPHTKVFDKNITGSRGALKRSKLKAISHSFRRPQDLCTEFHEMPRGTWDGILITSMTLNGQKNSFYDCFGVIPWLHDTIINWSFGGILGQFRWCEPSGTHYKSCRTPYE